MGLWMDVFLVGRSGGKNSVSHYFNIVKLIVIHSKLD